MKSKYLAVFGIITLILSVASSTKDLAGNYTLPTVLIVLSALATLVFTILAVIRLWRPQKITAILFLILSLISLAYTSTLIKIINFILLIWVISLLLTMDEYEGFAKELQKDSGLTEEEFSTILKEKQRGNDKAAEQILTLAQERNKQKFKEITGLNIEDAIFEVGKEIPWNSIINHAFRVLELDRSGTIVEPNGKIKKPSPFLPYGYLIMESPIFNVRVKLPIIHRLDLFLAASVFDNPLLSSAIQKDKELLTVYAPKRTDRQGKPLSGWHHLHYVIAPRGTLDNYYSKNNGIYMVKPEPQKLVGKFVYVYFNIKNIEVGVYSESKF